LALVIAGLTKLAVAIAASASVAIGHAAMDAAIAPAKSAMNLNAINPLKPDVAGFRSQIWQSHTLSFGRMFERQELSQPTSLQAQGRVRIFEPSSVEKASVIARQTAFIWTEAAPVVLRVNS
jgi:hypothetical protein